MRLGRKHEITEAYDGTLDAVLNCHRLSRTQALADRGNTPDAKEERRQLMHAVQEQTDAFADLAFGTAGSQI